MEWVVMVVETGFLSHSTQEVMIMWKEKAKLIVTVITQPALAKGDLAVAMCVKPWMVEVSRNSLIKFIVVRNQLPED